MIRRSLFILVTLATAACLRGEAKEIYQLASSGSNPFTFQRAVELTGLAARRMYGSDDSTTYERLVLRHLEPHTQDVEKKQIFDIPQAQTESVIEPDCMTADFRRISVSVIQRSVALHPLILAGSGCS